MERWLWLVMYVSGGIAWKNPLYDLKRSLNYSHLATIVWRGTIVITKMVPDQAVLPLHRAFSFEFSSSSIGHDHEQPQAIPGTSI